MDVAAEIGQLKREVRTLRLLIALGAAGVLVAAAPPTRVLQADRLVLGPPDAPWLVAESGKVELTSGKDGATRHRLVLGAEGTRPSSEQGPSTVWLTPSSFILRNDQGETQIESRRMAVMGTTDATFELGQTNRSAMVRLKGTEGRAELEAGSWRTGRSPASARLTAGASADSLGFARVTVSEGAVDGQGAQSTSTIYGAAGVVKQ